MEDKISLAWANPEKTILLVTYEKDGWTWQDLYESLKQQKAMIDTVDHKVHLIVDSRKTSMFPQGGSLLSGIRKITVERHTRQGHIVTVGAHGIVRVMSQIVERLMGEYRQDFHFAETMEDAYAFLGRLTEQQDKTVSRR